MNTVRARVRRKVDAVLRDYVLNEMRAHAEFQGHELARLTTELGAVREAIDTLASVREALDSSLRSWERRTRRDLLTVTDQLATRSSAEFQLREMPRATPYFEKRDTLVSAVKAAPAQGLFLEFGVATGSTLRTIAELAPGGSVFGFDSFEGLPEDWRTQFVAGSFAQEKLPDVPGAELVVGWFDQTLPGFLAEHPEEIAFLHMDADLYSSTVTVLDAVHSRLRPGTIVIFDEYFNFPDWEQHEHRAWTEFVARTGITFEYLGFTADDEQVSLRLTSVPGIAGETDVAMAEALLLEAVGPEVTAA